MKSYKKNLSIIISDIVEQILISKAGNESVITDAVVHKMSKAISEAVQEYNTSFYKDFMAEHQELALKYEQNRTMFTDYINLLKKESEKLLKLYKDKGFVSVEFDNKKRKNILVYKTQMLKETCEFINSLNDIVVQYNSDVMNNKNQDLLSNEMTLF